MTSVIELDGVRRRNALSVWSTRCQRAFERRYPHAAFGENHWPIQSLHGSTVRDINLEPSLRDFEGRHPSFGEALRCIAANISTADQVKEAKPELDAFRLLKDTSAVTLFELSISHLRSLETTLLEKAKIRPETAQTARHLLTRLGRQLETLSAKDIIHRLVYTPSREVTARFAVLQRGHRERLKGRMSESLDHKIEALSDAISAAFRSDSRLSPTDISTLSLMGMEMCAPSRVNEILCLSVDDHVTLEDYVNRSTHKDSDQIHAAHQALIITMKGSKGAAWGPKPVLSFMIALFNLAIEKLMHLGEGSRALIKWYEDNPNKLFLPPEFEFLRGTQITVTDLWRIMNFAQSPPEGKRARSSNVTIFRELKSKVILLPNPRFGAAGQKMLLPVLPWEDVEAHLLKRVHSAMDDCRRVTLHNYYKGTLSKMLFLLDTQDTPYLPGSLKYATVARRLKPRASDIEHYKQKRRSALEPSIFEKLGILMPKDGKVCAAEIDTHDPRRWLTTQALLHREKLSDVLINKWARRLDIRQLDSYDLGTAEQKADRSAMPKIVELSDLSAGLEAIQKAQESCGVRNELIVIEDAQIKMTSMAAIGDVVESRPIAKTAEQLFIIYPNWYGACVHQHHEKPCTAYSSCLPCDNNLVVKGHLPTNEEVRNRSQILFQSIVNQLDKLAVAHSRGIADNPDKLAEHVLTLATKGLSAENMADELIQQFHDIRHLIKDITFANKLEEAFVAKGMVRQLDNPEVPSGALIKYHNPTRHASPGLERALDAQGTRTAVVGRRERLIKIYPEFATTSSGLIDQRSLLLENENEEIGRELEDKFLTEDITSDD